MVRRRAWPVVAASAACNELVEAIARPASTPWGSRVPTAHVTVPVSLAVAAQPLAEGLVRFRPVRERDVVVLIHAVALTLMWSGDDQEANNILLAAVESKVLSSDGWGRAIIDLDLILVRLGGEIEDGPDDGTGRRELKDAVGVASTLRPEPRWASSLRADIAGIAHRVLCATPNLCVSEYKSKLNDLKALVGLPYEEILSVNLHQKIADLSRRHAAGYTRRVSGGSQ